MYAPNWITILFIIIWNITGMSGDLSLLMQIHQDVLENTTLRNQMQNIQKTRYKNVKGLFLLYVDQKSGVKFVKNNELEQYFSQKTLVKMVRRRVACSNPDNDFVLGTVIPDGESYFNNYKWDATAAIVVKGV
jgi:hypothetical protein